MLNSTMETSPKPSENPPFKFPPHRRRLLRSKTLCSLIRVLSHCHQDFQRSRPLLHKPDNGGKGAEQVSTVQCDQLVGHHDLGREEALLREESLVEENRELRSSQDTGFTKEHMEVDGLNPMDIVKGNGDLGHPDFIDSVNSVDDRNQNNNDFAALRVDLEDQFSFPDFNIEEFGYAEQLGEKALSFREVLETIDSFIDTDVAAGPSKDIENKEETSSPLGRISEMQQKGRESEELVSASCVMESSPIRSTAEDIEDGEISGDTGFYEKSMEFLHEDVAALENKSVDKVQASEDTNHKEELSRNEPRREFEKDKQCNPLPMNTINHMDNAMEVELRKENRNLVENRPKLVFYGDIIEDKIADRENSRSEIGRNKKQGSRPKKAPEKASSLASCPKNLALGGESSGGNAMENQCSPSTEKDASVSNKKRKRGPETQERKAKKKKKERMKRAEKNRQLGVKRLKLQPALKPKTVTYCRHYLKGRCHEGEKCKFSHDTIPLTKSKPCCHFARQSCMKGDDCPFDHQLSKYPCNNYLSQGSCSRGADCMFSHELPVKEASPIASDVGKPELKSVSTKGNLTFKKQMSPNSTSHPNVSGKLCSSGISSYKNKEKNAAGTTPKSSGQTPKGISFLSHGKSSTGNTSNQEQDALSPKADNGVKVGHQINNGVSNVAQILNENTKRKPPVTPRGINFLSFGKAPSEDSGSKKSSSFSFISNLEIGKSPLSDSSKNEQAGSSAKRDNVVKVDSQTGQGVSSMIWKLNEMASRTPAVAPRSVNLLSVGNAQLDSSENKKRAGFCFKEDNAVPPTVQERERLIQHQISNAVLPDQLVSVRGKSTPSSSQGSLLSNTPSSVQKALRSTLAFAAKFQSEVKKDRSYGSPAVATDFSKEASSSQNKSMKNASTILDFLYGANSKTN